MKTAFDVSSLLPQKKKGASSSSSTPTGIIDFEKKFLQFESWISEFNFYTHPLPDSEVIEKKLQQIMPHENAAQMRKLLEDDFKVPFFTIQSLSEKIAKSIGEWQCQQLQKMLRTRQEQIKDLKEKINVAKYFDKEHHPTLEFLGLFYLRAVSGENIHRYDISASNAGCLFLDGILELPFFNNEKRPKQEVVQDLKIGE